MAPQRKNTIKPTSPNAFQSEDRSNYKISSFEVQINVKHKDHPSQATRSRTAGAILQDTPPSLKRKIVVPVGMKNRVVNLMFV